MKGDDIDLVFSRGTQQPSFAKQIRPGSDNAVEAVEDAIDRTVYRPFGLFPGNGFTDICDVRTWVDGTTIAEGVEFQYRFLMHVSYVEEQELRLHFPDSIIVIEGCGLTHLRQRLRRKAVTHIQQFNPKVWVEGETRPCRINRIEILRP